MYLCNIFRRFNVCINNIWKVIETESHFALYPLTKAPVSFNTVTEKHPISYSKSLGRRHVNWVMVLIHTEGKVVLEFAELTDCKQVAPFP